jgi:integrase
MSIYRDKKSGRWRFEFDCYINGQRHRKRRLLPAGWSRADAEAYASKEGKALSAIAQGIARPRHAIDEAVARYAAERLPYLKHGANVRRELAWLEDWYRGRALEDLPEVCAEYAEDQDGALAPATIRNRIAYLRAACRYAWKRHRLCDHDPGARVVVPSVSNERRVYIDRGQMLRLARQCRHWGARAMIRIAWYSGMRLSEIERAEADLEARVFRLADTKNGDTRTVPIHPRILVCLQFQIPSRYTFGYHFRAARAAIDMPELHAHDLRHSAATEMLATGSPLHTVGAVLGHRSAASMRRYAHVKDEAAREAVNRMGRRSPIAPQTKQPPRGPSTEVEARAGVEPTYTDLQSKTALGAHGASEVTTPRADRVQRLKRAA